MFTEKLNQLKNGFKDDDVIALAFGLIDFLEDWFLDHLANEDQKYAQCFKAHGLK